MPAQLMLVISIFLWSGTFIAQKFCFDYLQPLEILGLRLLIGLPVIFGILRIRKIGLALSFSDLRLTIFASIILGSHFLVQITGLKYTTASNTAWIVSIEPLIVVFLAYFFLGERIGRGAIYGIMVSTVGIGLLLTKGNPGNFAIGTSYGDLLVLVSAHTWAIYTIASRDLVRRQDPLLVTFWMLFPSFVIVLGSMSVTSDWGAFLHFPYRVYLAILYLGILGMAVAHWFWQHGVAALGSSRAGIFLYLEPVMTTLMAVPFLGEPLEMITIMGGVLVIAGVWLVEKKS